MRVMVVVSNQEYASSFDPFPPVGTKGTVTEGEDKYGEFEVVFDNYPNTTLDNPDWTVHKSMIVFLGDDKSGAINNSICKNEYTT
jgi:hypothetical protein